MTEKEEVQPCQRDSAQGRLQHQGSEVWLIHVHISPKLVYGPKRDWSIDELKAIIVAVSRFDEQIMEILPAERKNNTFAMPKLIAGNPKESLRTCPLTVQVLSGR